MSILSYDHGSCTVPLLAETIGENLRRTVERHGQREALVVRHQGYRASYEELWDQTGRAARGLMARGIERGDRIGVWATNRWEWVVLQYAAARAGAILVSLNPAYRTAELEYALNQSGICLLVLAQAFRTADYPAMLAQVRDRCPRLREAVVLEDGWEALLQDVGRVGEEALSRREAEVQFDDAASIQYTSGTTGFPKGATLSHHNILNNAFFVGEQLGYTEHERVCVPVPFSHCFGMVLGNLACTTHGACVVVPTEAFDPLATMQTVQDERCTSLYGVPTMFIAELEHPEFARFDLSSLRTGVMGGAPCPAELVEKVESSMHMAGVSIGYGMTETSPISTQTGSHDPHEKRVSTVGRVHPHVEVKVIDPATGAVLPRGAEGEICSRGYLVMLGYWESPEATCEAVDAAGWMHTGDLGTMDAEGYLTVVGRSKDMIIRGGENVYPREVEDFLHSHPGVADVHVIGVPSQRYGEEVMAWVRLRDGSSLTGDDLGAYCRGRITPYKVPRYWKFVDGFPMTVSGKVQKFRMRAISIDDLGLEDAVRRVHAT
jgi:fatty-acyl-CoA synthase